MSDLTQHKDMTNNCRIAWRAPSGATGHGIKWRTRAACESDIKAQKERESEDPIEDRPAYWVETKTEEAKP